MKLGFIGAGAAGSALATAWARAGVPIVAVASRRLERARALAERLPGCRAVETPQEVVEQADLVFLTVPDRAIAPVCASLDWRAGVSAIHCSGAHSLDVLESARAAGAAVGGCHPLQTLAGAPEDADRLAGSVFGIEADEPLWTTLVELVRRFDGRPVHLAAEDKALYHASAVLISNYTVTLAAVAAELWQMFAVPVERDAALQALMPLLRGAVENLVTQGLPHALTGPIARGDAATVARHLAALGESQPEVQALYRVAGHHTVPVARERGSHDPEGLEAVIALLGQGDDE